MFSGLSEPVAVQFSGDGRAWVAEKSGLIKLFDDLSDTTPTIFADLQLQVHNYWDRGLLGFALHPNFPTVPYVYVLYTLDAAIGGTPPRWGDDCPTPPGPLVDGCVVGGRLSRLEAAGSVLVGTEQIFLEDWCQQYPSHSVGALAFGEDGALYASAGEGASFRFVDWGQDGDPVNPCGDPGGPTPTPPTAEGGALRSQDLRTAGDPVTFDGALLRLDPTTGAALPDNPLFGGEDVGDDRIIAYGLRNPFRFAPRPGTEEIWIGDPGSRHADEINRILDVNDAVVENFGWPCYEGPNRNPSYDAADLAICENLYAEPSAVTPPFFHYTRSQQVVPGESCPDGNSAIAGLAFHHHGTYPAAYEGALFFADHERNCIWVVFADENGTIDLSTRATFVAGAANPVDLKTGPGGDLFYVDFEGGTVRRIQFFTENQPPIASVVANPTSGLAPLRVEFDGSGSHDPDAEDSITYAWDLNGDGEYDDSTLVNPEFTYTEPGTYAVRLRVTDLRGATGTDTVVISADNSAPTATILTPSPSTTWSVGDVVFFSGHATDWQEGTLPAAALSWRLLLHHCPLGCHTHTVQTFAGVADGSFSAPDHDLPAHLELELTATDSGGLTNVQSVVLYPNTVQFTLTSSPPGLQLLAGLVSEVAPFSRPVIVGSTQSITAPSPQFLGETPYQFASWSDGGPQSHNVLADPWPTTFTATFVAVVPELTLSPSVRDFGKVAIGQASPPQVFAIGNNGVAPLVVTSAALVGRSTSQFALDCPSWPVTVAVGDEVSCSVIFRPVARGQQSATLTVGSNDPEHPTMSARLVGVAVEKGH